MNFFLNNDIEEILIRSKNELFKFDNKNILITGSHGFLGKYFLAVFDKMQKNVNFPNFNKIVAVDNNISSSKLLQFNNLSYIDQRIGNVTDKIKLNEKFDFIIHLAGIASPQYYLANPLETIDAAVNTTKYLLEIAKNCNSKLTFFSSSEIYGDPTDNFIPTPESYRGNVSSRGPRACYDESKRLGETLCWIYNNYYQVTANVIRPFNVFGPGMQPTDYRVLPNFAWSIRNNTPLNIYGTGFQTRTFCYINDAIDGFLKVITSDLPSDAYNVGNPNPEISMNDLAALIAQIQGKILNINHIPYPDNYPSDEPLRRCPDINKINKTFNFYPQIDLKTGLKRFLHWVEKV